MEHLDFPAMIAMQEELQARYRDKWEPIDPAHGRNKLLWMMIEAGEAADIIKKSGDDAIMQPGDTRRHFVEELTDTLMYLNDVLLCYGISAEELEQIYVEKHERNMKRW